MLFAVASLEEMIVAFRKKTTASTARIPDFTSWRFSQPTVQLESHALWASAL
jgi:hypothetical protein